MKYEHLLYKRGFLFSQTDIELPLSSWTKKTIGVYFISFDPENPWEFIEEKDNWVAFLGKAIDTLNWSADISSIVRHCFDSLNYSEEKMLDYIDYLNGRFILIYHRNGITKFMNDAFGTRSVFYSLKDKVVIASHCEIISNYLESPILACADTIINDNNWYSPPSHGFPGNLTPYQDIFVLTPNTLIYIEKRKVQRFYPRRELPFVNSEDIIEEVSVLLKRQIELLCSQYKLAISITAGIDTRVTLAAAKDIARDVQFFTYGDLEYLDGYINNISPNIPNTALAGSVDLKHKLRRRSLEIDMIVAHEITQALELHHIPIMDITVQQEDFNEFNYILDHNTYHRHGRTLAHKYFITFPPDLLHIRSNLGEIGRCFYRKGGMNELPLTAEYMAQAWHNKMSKNEAIIETFRQYDSITNFNVQNALCNYDPYDIFYWEHRMGTWLTNVLIESDVAFDTFHLFNCRTLIEKMLSVPIENRLKSEIHYGIIKCLWPILLQWPINQPPYRIQLENLRTELAGAKKEQDKFVSNLVRKRKSNDRTLNKHSKIVDSMSYQLGYIIIQTVIKPGRNTVALPYRLMKLMIQAIKIMKKNRADKIAGITPEVEQSQE